MKKAPATTTAARSAKKPASLLQQLQHETAQRREVEAKLAQCQQAYELLRAQSALVQEQLRDLSHQVLLAQEEERKLISRELHDEISQILASISIRLAALKLETTASVGGLKKKIVSTQKLVEKSVATVLRFAHGLRPPMLDDLGLIPALLTFIREFGKRNALKVNLKAEDKEIIERLDSLKRTMLYRVVQEALTNAGRHANASEVTVVIASKAETIHLKIHDNGQSFDVSSRLSTPGHHCMGILGMRERVELMNGTFGIDSSPGQGTTINVQIPYH